MNGDNDIIKAEFPEYSPEQSAIPDVEKESSFSEHKDEIYRRNIALAANEADTHRKLYPDNADAEEIYPQAKAGADGYFAVKKSGNKRKIPAAVFYAAIVVIVAAAAFFSGRNGRALDINAAAVSKADENAKKMYTAASACIVKMYVEGIEIDGHNFENSGTVFIFGNTENNMAELLGNSFSGYVYGVFEYETCNVEYTLWSAEPIPDEYKRILTESEQAALAGSGIIIGCYPSAAE